VILKGGIGKRMRKDDVCGGTSGSGFCESDKKKIGIG